MPIAPEDLALLKRHVPELRYHENEAYRAGAADMMIDSFEPLRYSNGLLRRPTPVLALADPARGIPGLTPALLKPKGMPYWPGIDKTAGDDDYLYAHRGTEEEDAQRIQARPGYGDVVYGRIWPLERGQPRFLQYWFFFYSNPHGFAGIGLHQGDWEMVQVAVSAADVPEGVAYSRHGHAFSRIWAGVPKSPGDEDVPVVYVARGSHAAYFHAGKHDRRVIRTWIPDIFENLVNKRAADHTSDGGATVRPDLRLTDDEPWLNWPGRWGSTYQKIDKSPRGPAISRGEWTDPAAYHRGGFEAEARQAALEEATAVALEEAVAPAPPAPEVSASLAQDAVKVDYSFAASVGEWSRPVRLEVGVQGDVGPPAVAVVDLRDLEGTLWVRLPLGRRPYTVRAAAYDEYDTETMTGPLPVDEPTAGATLEELSARAPRVAPRRTRPPDVDAEPVLLLVRVPEAGVDAEIELNRAVAALEPAAEWQANPVFGTNDRSGEPELSRHFMVTGRPRADAGLEATDLTFEAARAIRSLTGWEVQPDPVMSVYRPAEPESEPAAGLESDELDMQWAVDALQCRDAWKLAPPPGGRSCGEGIVIGHPDTGFAEHPELETGMLDLDHDFDVLTGDDDAHADLSGVPPFSFYSHGTSTASVIASRAVGRIYGAAPLAQLLPVRCARTVIRIRDAYLAMAVNAARTRGCHVISISLGGLAFSSTLRVAIQRAVEEGLIVMAAAGQPLPLVVDPAAYRECLGIGGTVFGGDPWRWSARGPEVDVSAPARNVPVATVEAGDPPLTSVALHTGTSFSVALVAGAAALWLAYHGRDRLISRFGPENLQWAFRSALRQTVTVPERWDAKDRGAGIPNARELLQLALDDVVVEEPPDPEPPDRAERVLARASRLVDAPTDLVRMNVAALLGEDRDRIAGFGDELVYRIGEDTALRAALAEKRDVALAGAATARARLESIASPSLRDALA